MLAVSLLLGGCSLDSILRSDELPPDVRDPALIETAEGALAAYYGARAQFGEAFGGAPARGQDAIGFIGVSGLLGDELQSMLIGGGAAAGSHAGAIDARMVPELGAGATSAGSPLFFTYAALQKARAQAGQAIGLLARFAPDSLQPLAGHLYAVQGYAELFLAELFCSGVPLSTIDFDGDYTARPGSPTAELYEHALALFDSAHFLAGDSLRFVHLAGMGRARALLNIGELADAAAIAAQIPDGYRYEITFTSETGATARNFAWIDPVYPWPLTVADLEGMAGLNYRTSGDPRATATAFATNEYGYPLYHPDKYATDGSSPLVVASGLEARLIEAEADLATGGAEWLTILNTLRTDGTFTVTSDSDDPAQEDTLWHAGTGGTEGLAPLEDPPDADARLDLLFRERAFWLFLTGHRQADLRRLVRHYGRAPDSVYPSGPYPGGRFYGGDVTLPVPPEERSYNPRFTGCLSRGA